MPLYEYKCSKCDQVFEVIQKFSDQPLAVHENCGGEVARLVSRSALQFKGTGWYITDYARSGSGKPNGKPAPDSGGADSKSKTESAKPAASAPAESSSK